MADLPQTVQNSRAIVWDEKDLDTKCEPEELEDGQLSTSPNPYSRKLKTLCRFYKSGTCFYGAQCTYLHPGMMDTGRYTMHKTIHPNNLISLMKIKHMNEKRISCVSFNFYRSSDPSDPYLDDEEDISSCDSNKNPWERALSRMNNSAFQEIDSTKIQPTSTSSVLRKRSTTNPLHSKYGSINSSRIEGIESNSINFESWKDPWMRPGSTTRRPINAASIASHSKIKSCDDISRNNMDKDVSNFHYKNTSNASCEVSMASNKQISKKRKLADSSSDNNDSEESSDEENDNTSSAGSSSSSSKDSRSDTNGDSSSSSDDDDSLNSSKNINPTKVHTLSNTAHSASQHLSSEKAFTDVNPPPTAKRGLASMRHNVVLSKKKQSK